VLAGSLTEVAQASMTAKGMAAGSCDAARQIRMQTEGSQCFCNHCDSRNL
jgi:hypothetical protein